jgi:adenylate kinase
MLVIFVGPPGAGKGTQSKRLVHYLGATHLSTGDMLRAEIEAGSELGEKARDYMDHGRLVPCEIMVDVIAERLKQLPKEKPCLLDGFPRTIQQAEELDRILQGMSHWIQLVLVLMADRDELRRRMLQRATEEGRSDDTPEKITRRFEVYDEQTRPLIEYYEDKSLLRRIDAMGTPDEVFERIKKAVDKVA